MLTIDLGNSEQYQKIKYPAGELQLRFLPTMLEAVKTAQEIRVIARVRSCEDLLELHFLLGLLADYEEACKNLELVLPYLPYGRADRRFVPGDMYGLSYFEELVAGPGTWRLQVKTLDVHSDKANSVFVGTSFVNIRPHVFIQKALEDFSKRVGGPIDILFPDEGAKKRYAGEHLAGHNVYYGTKKRDPETGKLSGFEIPEELESSTTAVLIVDDLCDGGGTFVGIASLLSRHIPKALYVTHGIFSKGLEPLFDQLDHVYTTDSFRVDYEAHKQLTVFPCMEALIGEEW